MKDATLTSDDIARIGAGLLDRSLPKAEWTHAAHVAASVWVIAARPDLVPERDIPDAIRAYNEATGVPNTETGGYHATITLASLRRIAAEIGVPAGGDLGRLHAGVMAAGLADQDWLLAYWSPALLMSAGARRAWAAPDRAAFPWPSISRPSSRT